MCRLPNFCLAQVLPRQQLSAVLLPSHHHPLPPRRRRSRRTRRTRRPRLRRCSLMGSGFVPTPSPAGGRWPSARPSSDGQVLMMRAMSVCVCVMCACRALFCVTGDAWARPFVGLGGRPIYGYMPRRVPYGFEGACGAATIVTDFPGKSYARGHGYPAVTRGAGVPPVTRPPAPPSLHSRK